MFFFILQIFNRKLYSQPSFLTFPPPFGGWRKGWLMEDVAAEDG
jgi:hypothetical protein